MQCPKCSNEMSPEERKGVEIDVCPDCGGIYLDRGEIDRIGGPLRAPNRETVGPRISRRDYFLAKEHVKSIEEMGCLPSNVFIG